MDQQVERVCDDGDLVPGAHAAIGALDFERAVMRPIAAVALSALCEPISRSATG